MASIDDVAFYILSKEKSKSLGTIKLHILLYYVQAWHIVKYNKPLFNGRFQAWIRGPINLKFYVKKSHNVYSVVKCPKVNIDFTKVFNQYQISLIDEVLDAYGNLSTFQLTDLIRREDPWLIARKGEYWRKCKTEISENDIKKYYVRFLE